MRLQQFKRLYTNYHQANAGFTLIELMVTVAILAILASIAIPSYREYAIRNAEYEAQARMKQVEIELTRWRSSALTYKDFKPKKIDSNGSTSFGYDVDDKIIYVPANTNNTNYRYKITLVDGADTSKSLVTSENTVNNAIGRAWTMLAEPNTAKFSNAHKILLNSTGTQCKTRISDNSITLSSSNCGTYSEAW